jgi:energy-coupling factor transporter ATP-binding protein EcfA2
VEISRNKDLIKRNKQEAKRIKIVSKARKRIEKEASSGKSSQEKYTKVDKEIQILIKAIEILEEGTSQISRKVLPKTNENLSRILPILTAGRYKDSKIEYDYKILLFDSKRKGYVNKVLYSGGTNDQIALAVRLAFAMATMQEEALGESFIFLDEPLGFFDDERRHALIDFLTHGVISQKFAQRFVVSNYLEIKPYFDYVIELENGKIINEHYTGTLESQQAEIQGQYTSANQVKMLELKTIKGEEEDGCYYGILHLINVSSHTITRLKLTILDNIYVDIGTTNFYEPILPQTFIKLEPNFSDEILTMGEIHVKAHIKYLIGKQLHSLEQTIIYVPELK